jgi:hypothetical protein
MESNALDLLVKQMEEEKLVFSQALLSGTLKDFAEYKAICGKISGVAVAQRLVGEMKIRLQKQNE